MSEFRRVLKHGGWCAAFWNVRGSTPFMRDYDALLRTVGDYQNVPKPEEAIEAIERHPDVRGVVRIQVPHVQVLDRAGLLGRAASSSYVAHGVTDRQAFEATLGALFDRHSAEGRVDFTYDTTCRMWRFEE